MHTTPVLEVGGTHVTAALVELADAGATVLQHARIPLDADAPADVILDVLADAGRLLGASPDAHWGVAMPGPFDYDRGIGRFVGVGKFDALNGVDVGVALAARLGSGTARPSFTFLNDAAAYGIGEWFVGAAAGARRAVCVTLGTGTGGCFLDDGRPITSGDEVPPEGVLHLLTYEGEDLEEFVSRRALIAAYRRAAGQDLDAQEIAAAALAADPVALGVFEKAYGVLAAALDPWLRRFEAEVVVVGGSIARSWELVERFLAPGLSVPVLHATHEELAPLVGAAHFAAR